MYMKSSNKAARIAWIIFYLAYYPVGRLLILAEYIPSRLWHGYTNVFRNYGIFAGCFMTLFTTGCIGTYFFAPIPILMLWFMGRKAWFAHYEKPLDLLHSDWSKYAA